MSSMVERLGVLAQPDPGPVRPSLAMRLAMMFNKIFPYSSTCDLNRYSEGVVHWCQCIRQLNPKLSQDFANAVRTYRQLKDAIAKFEQPDHPLPPTMMTYIGKSVTFNFDHNPNRIGHPPPVKEIKIILPPGSGLAGPNDMSSLVDIVNAVRRVSKRRSVLANLESAGPALRRRRLVEPALALADQ